MARDLLSVVLYGSAASGEYVEGRSNINCLVLLKEVTPDELRKCAARLPEWHKQGISTPLFVDPAYVRSSVDVFPSRIPGYETEIPSALRRKTSCRSWNLKLERLRFQCEQELKGKDAAIAATLSRSIANGKPACCPARKVDQFVHGPFSSATSSAANPGAPIDKRDSNCSVATRSSCGSDRQGSWFAAQRIDSESCRDGFALSAVPFRDPSSS